MFKVNNIYRHSKPDVLDIKVLDVTKCEGKTTLKVVYVDRISDEVVNLPSFGVDELSIFDSNLHQWSERVARS